MSDIVTQMAQEIEILIEQQESETDHLARVMQDALDEIERLRAAVVAERERCAKIADNAFDCGMGNCDVPDTIAAAIREQT